MSDQNGSKWFSGLVAIAIFILAGTGALYAKVQSSEARINLLEGAMYEIRNDIKLLLSRTK